MADTKTSRGSDQFPLRLPDGMREKIRAAAESSGRSMNSEIVARLAESFTLGDREHQAFMGHIASVDAFMKSAPDQRDQLVIALLEQVELIRSLSDRLREAVGNDAKP